MNFKQFTTVIVAILTLCGVAFAQQSKSDPRVEFRPHLYIQIQGGVGYTLGETSFGDLLSPSAYLSLGYKFIPALGVRVGVGGWQGRGCIVSPEQLYSYYFVQGNADLLLDVTSLFGGFDHHRLCTFYLLGGFGITGGIDNSEARAISTASSSSLPYLWDKKVFIPGRFGLGVDFRLTDCLSINVEGNANVLSDKFNSKRADNSDWQINLLAGLSFKFGKSYRPCTSYIAEQKAAEEAARAAERAAEERAAAEKAAEEKAAADRIAAEQMAADKAREESRKAEEAKEAERARTVAEHSDEIYFLIGSDAIRREEGRKIDTMASWLCENPDYRVVVVGYADRETGSAETNWKLSERRARNVKARLVKGGVEESRIDVDYKGDTVQPNSKPELNRVVICTLE